MKRRHPLLALVLVWGLGAPAAMAAPAGKPTPSPQAATISPEGVLLHALQAEANLIFRGDLDVNGESRLTITQGSDRRRKEEWRSPAAMAGDIVIDNGSLRWSYSPQEGHADVSPSEQFPLGPAVRLAMIRQNYRIHLRPGRPMANEATRLLVLEPRAPHAIEHRLYVANRGLALRTERWRLGRMLDYTAYVSIDWQPRLVRGTFAPQLPTGAQVKPTIHVLASGQDLRAVATKLNFRPVLPGRLPIGFRAVAVRAFTTGAGSAPVAHWQLTDGMSSLSLFARKATAWRLPPDSQAIALPGGVQAARMDQGMATMLVWQVGGVRYSLVGTIAPEALIDTAASSVRPPAPKGLSKNN